MKHPILGILGGLGPAAGAYFYDMLIRHTAAHADSEHIDVLLSGAASTPDRTGYILGKSTEDPMPEMLSCARSIVSIGADYVAIPCNTAHYFYDAIAQGVNVPVVNIIRETVSFLASIGVRRMGLLATEGTVGSGAYAKVCEEFGIECVTPDAADQTQIMRIIYDQIKAGEPVDTDTFRRVCDRLRDVGCERLVLGCTELSLLKRDGLLTEEDLVDSLEVLACRCITLCGKSPVGFDTQLMNYMKGRG